MLLKTSGITGTSQADFEEVEGILREQCGGVLVGEYGQCIGCHACIRACPKQPASLLDGRWIEYGVVRIAPVCRNCRNPRCVVACRKDAIRKTDGRVVIDEKTCTGCGACAKACPFGTILMRTESHASPPYPRSDKGTARPIRRRAVKCDRCEGRGSPACVHECPTGALVFIDCEKLKNLAEPPITPPGGIPNGVPNGFLRGTDDRPEGNP